MARGQRFTACPLIAFEGLVTHEASGRRASGVQVYGVDERFWRFHGVTAPELPAMSAALAEELGSKPGDTVLLRVREAFGDSARIAAWPQGGRRPHAALHGTRAARGVRSR